MQSAIGYTPLTTSMQEDVDVNSLFDTLGICRSGFHCQRCRIADLRLPAGDAQPPGRTRQDLALLGRASIDKPELAKDQLTLAHDVAVAARDEEGSQRTAKLLGRRLLAPSEHQQIGALHEEERRHEYAP
ncbi:hypothetical protein QTI33_33005 [Variovorax sp. J22P271]|uniref:hypothetical protein n=1 Tax=Variovorax davisae TaxID=3053515 RepID=UPI00257550D5|nr:hypothetical protein [Variovorax sp. J22P271]MDM0036994.1 hypothetical protein [Variovorax sp. J22P271]